MSHLRTKEDIMRTIKGVMIRRKSIALKEAIRKGNIKYAEDKQKEVEELLYGEEFLPDDVEFVLAFALDACEKLRIAKEKV